MLLSNINRETRNGIFNVVFSFLEEENAKLQVYVRKDKKLGCVYVHSKKYSVMLREYILSISFPPDNFEFAFYAPTKQGELYHILKHKFFITEYKHLFVGK